MNARNAVNAMKIGPGSAPEARLVALRVFGCSGSSNVVGLALDRTNFTVDDRDRGRGIYFVRYVDPKDMTSAEQGFWNQVFHGKKEKLAKNYEVNVRALTETQTRVSIIDSKGNVDSSPQARQIMGLLDDQLR